MKKFLILICLHPIILFAQSSSITITGSSTMIVTTPTNPNTVFVTADGFYDSNSGNQFTVSGGTEDKADAYSDPPLPVELIQFSAILIENGVLLNWETATEINNYGFEVERKFLDNSNQSSVKTWETIGFVEGHGNSNSPKHYEFIDEQPLPDTLNYRLKQIDTDGAYEYYSIVAQVDASGLITGTEETIIPISFELKQNYPNPFNPTTEISYSIPETGFVSLKVYNLLGQLVAVLAEQVESAGTYRVNFDASSISSGVYFYSLKTDQNFSLKKMMLLK